MKPQMQLPYNFHSADKNERKHALYALQAFYLLHHHPDFNKRASEIWKAMYEYHRGNYFLLKLKGIPQRHLERIGRLLTDFFIPVDPFTVEVFRLYMVKSKTMQGHQTLENVLFGRWDMFINTNYGLLYKSDRKYGTRLQKSAYINIGSALLEALNQPSITVVLTNNVSKAEWMRIWESFQDKKWTREIMVQPVDGVFDREIAPYKPAITSRIKEMVHVMKAKRGKGKRPSYKNILKSLEKTSRAAKNWTQETLRKHYKEYESLICRLEEFRTK